MSADSETFSERIFETLSIQRLKSCVSGNLMGKSTVALNRGGWVGAW